jgi:hypothetical protein
MAIIDKPSDYFNTKLYTGTGSELAVTGVGFQPDWIWFKQRDATRSNALVDSVRGRSKVVFSDLTNAEETSAASTNDLVSFDSDGFTVGITSASGSFNTSSGSHVAWNWKAGTSFTNDASATGIGTIDSTGSFNNDSGFSIVSYTGNATDNASVKHGLNTAPKMVIIKDLSDTSVWGVWHQSLTNGGYRLTLNTNAAQTDDSAFIGGGDRAIPTSSVFFLGSGGGGNGANANIAYCFAPKQGYSKFGSYTGNNNANGPFVYTGFKPAFIMMKSTSTGGDNAYSWSMFDNKRSSYNIKRAMLKANLSDAEYTSGSNADVDILSNGFKMRSSPNETNGANTYIYMAFAENPFVSSTGVPATAR